MARRRIRTTYWATWTWRWPREPCECWAGRVARADRKTVTQNVPEHTIAVSHRKPLSAGIFRDSYSSQRHFVLRCDQSWAALVTVMKVKRGKIWENLVCTNREFVVWPLDIMEWQGVFWGRDTVRSGRRCICFVLTFQKDLLPSPAGKKVNLSLSAVWRRIWGVEVWLHSLPTSMLDGDAWKTSGPHNIE
jgi:hypothetical protein